MSTSSRSLEDLDEVLLDEIIPPVDLEVSVDLRHLGLHEILVACDNELLGIVSVIVWGIHDEADLGNVSAIALVVLEIINDPSIRY